MSTTPADERPVIQNIDAKIGALQRRITHLKERLDGTIRPENYKFTTSAKFDREELEALEAAVVALDYYD